MNFLSIVFGSIIRFLTYFYSISKVIIMEKNNGFVKKLVLIFFYFINSTSDKAKISSLRLPLKLTYNIKRLNRNFYCVKYKN